MTWPCFQIDKYQKRYIYIQRTYKLEKEIQKSSWSYCWRWALLWCDVIMHLKLKRRVSGVYGLMVQKKIEWFRILLPPGCSFFQTIHFKSFTFFLSLTPPLHFAVCAFMPFATAAAGVAYFSQKWIQIYIITFESFDFHDPFFLFFLNLSWKKYQVCSFIRKALLWWVLWCTKSFVNIVVELLLSISLFLYCYKEKSQKWQFAFDTLDIYSSQVQSYIRKQWLMRV